MDVLAPELIEAGLVSVCREMSMVVRNSAHSRVLNEGKDYSCALLDKNARIVGLNADSPGHIFPMKWSIRLIVQKYEVDMAPGDVFLTNDVYYAGTHLNDVAMVAPVYAEEELILFACVRAHWADIGGMVPGSLSGRAIEIFQEGVRIPPIRVVQAGVANQEVLDLLFQNVRQRDERIGDYYAMIHGIETGATRTRDLVSLYGLATFNEVVGRVLTERAETRMRNAIREAIPPGVYYHEDYLDSAGSLDEPVPICATVECHGDRLTVDFAGTASQVRGPTNCSLAVTTAAVFVAAKALLDPHSIVNDGSFVPIEVTAPEGTIVNAREPAAGGGFAEVRRRVQSTVMGALTRALPERSAGDQKGTANHFIISGTVGDRLALLYEYPAGGAGGTDRIDGPSAFSSFDEGDFVSIQSVEVVERDNPLRVERLALRVGSGGAGRHRGGLGLERVFVPTGEGLTLSVLSDRNIIQPFGVDLGRAGAANAFSVVRCGQEQRISDIPGKVMMFPLRQGDTVIARSAGGGGYGDPLDRPVDEVVRDLELAFIAARDAAESYGVVFGDDGGVDAAATARRRASLQQARVCLTVRGEASLAGHVNGRRLVRIAAPDAAEIGVGEMEILELARSGAAPFRVWARIDNAQEAGSVSVGPDLLGASGIDVGTTVTVHRM